MTMKKPCTTGHNGSLIFESIEYKINSLPLSLVVVGLMKLLFALFLSSATRESIKYKYE